MSKVIRISNGLHERLANYAEGFDTPANVIERILNQYEQVTPERADNDDNMVAAAEVVPELAPALPTALEAPAALLPIALTPESEERFKKELLKIKKAKIHIIYADGRAEDKTWNAFKFDSDSNVMANLRSRPEFRQDAWQKNGIERVEVSIDYTL